MKRVGFAVLGLVTFAVASGFPQVADAKGKKKPQEFYGECTCECKSNRSGLTLWTKTWSDTETVTGLRLLCFPTSPGEKECKGKFGTKGKKVCSLYVGNPVPELLFTPRGDVSQPRLGTYY